MSPRPSHRAVVIGGSIAGSLAAVALSAHFDDVVVLERDDLAAGGNRPGVQHAFQFHVLTAGGCKHIERLLPGLVASATAHGVPTMDASRDVVYRSRLGKSLQFDSGISIRMPSRRFLEPLVRARAEATPRVRFLCRTRVTGLRVAGETVTGIEAVGPDGHQATMPADLVVDAAGRRSEAHKWLESSGFDRPSEASVDAAWGYCTTYVAPPKGWDPGYSAFYMSPGASGNAEAAARGGAMWKQEGGRWVVTAQGCAGDHPPRDPAALKEYIRSTGSAELSTVLDQFEMLEAPQTWRNTANRRRDFGLVR